MSRTNRPVLSGCLALSAAGVLTAGCAAPSASRVAASGASVPAVRAAAIDRAVWASADGWSHAERTALRLNQKQEAAGRSVREAGWFALGYDDEAVYLRAELDDADLVCLAERDGDSLFRRGDTLEWFIGPPARIEADGTTRLGWYLELHVSPTGLRTATRWLRPGLAEVIGDAPFEAAVTRRGTANAHRDVDAGWSATLRLPWAALRAIDPSWTMDRPLTTLVARYNYGHHLPRDADGAGGPELSMFPPQPRTAFHLRTHHAPLELVPEPNRSAPSTEASP
ncbi:MAG: hypothetical protein AAGE65_13415 [Planctomycetota bacterium]